MEKSKQNLPNFYAGLEFKLKWVIEVARECGRSTSTVRAWCSGFGRTADEKCLKVLSERTKIPTDELFIN